MKKILIATIIAAFSMSAMAEGRFDKDTYDRAHEQSPSSQSNAGAVSNVELAPISNGSATVKDVNAASGSVAYIDNSTNVPAVQTIRNEGTSTVKMAPPVSAPSLTSSNDTCMGSSSFGASGIGFGLTIGSSWTDANCVMLKNAREMFNMGMPDVAFARLCMDALNKEAIELTGRVCPQTTRDASKTAK